MSKYKILILGIVAVVVLTGCLQGMGNGNGDLNGNDGVVDNGTQERTVAVAISLGDEAPEGVTERLNLSRSDQLLLRQAQQAPDELSEEEQERARQIQQDIQEAQQEIEEEREQAIQEMRQGFESTINESENLVIEDRIDQSESSLLLLSGSPSELLDLLDEENVEFIIGEQRYEEVLERQQQQAQAPSP